MVFDELHRPQLWGAGHGHSPCMGEETVQGIETGTQHALNMVDGVEQLRIGFDLPPRQHLDRAGLAHARLVVAVDVCAHIQFEFVFLRIEQFLNLLGIADRIRAARDGARDRTGLDPLSVRADEHFR